MRNDLRVTSLIVVVFSLCVVGCNAVPMPESAILIPLIEWDAADEPAYPFANDESPSVRAAAKELQQAREGCVWEWRDGKSVVISGCNAEAEEAAKDKLYDALAEARGQS